MLLKFVLISFSVWLCFNYVKILLLENVCKDI